MPTDAEILNWLEAREVDFIGFTDGCGLDIANSPLGLRAELTAQMKEEAHAEQTR